MANLEFIEDGMTRKVISYKDNAIVLERRDPFGFISIFMQKGQTPVDFKGEYTEFEYAIQAVNRYLNNKEPKDDGRPKIKYKRSPKEAVSAPKE